MTIGAYIINFSLVALDDIAEIVLSEAKEALSSSIDKSGKISSSNSASELGKLVDAAKADTSSIELVIKVISESKPGEKLQDKV